jgi:hypothetical protein
MPETPEIPEQLPLAKERAVIAEAPSLSEGETMAPDEVGGGTPTSQNQDVGHPTPEAAVVAENDADESEKEETPMLDVHLPQATHTWKDFWIHLGTISVGLLIAIGLEQGVEKLHHLEQGRQLGADLQQEALLNRDRIAFNEAAVDGEMAWLLRLRRDVIALRDGATKQSFAYPERPQIYPTNPNRSSARLPLVTVWTTAKESNLIQLLPQESARHYAFLYQEADLATDALLGLQDDKWQELDKFELRFDGGVPSGKPNVAKMTPAQLDEYASVLGDVYLECRMAKRRMKVYAAWNESILAPGKPFEGADDYLRTHPDPAIDLSK